MEKGMSIFLDVFRRADKNDDGAISWEEFGSFFADGVMGKEELEALFKEIDTHNTNNIDTGELCEYFSKHLGEFKEIYGLVEDLNNKVSNVLMSTSQKYESSGRTDQFVTRFLLREVVKQVTALQDPLEAASESLDDHARKDRSDVKPAEPSDVVPKQAQDIVPGRIVRRARRQASNQSQSGDSIGPVNPVALGVQVDRLTSLLDRLEHSVNFGNFVDEDLNAVEDDKLMLIQTDMKIKEDHQEDFRVKLREYIETTQNSPHCESVSVRYYKDSGTFTVYEIWQSELKHESYCQENGTFKDKFGEYLEKMEPERTVCFPVGWWKHD